MELTQWIIFLVGALLFPSILTVYGVKKVSSWKEREFGTYNFNWKAIFTASFATGFIVPLILFLFTSNPWIAISVSPLAYMLVLGSVTDLKVTKIPLGISVLAYLLPLPILLTSTDGYGRFSLGVWFSLVLLFGVFWWFGAFGLADLRIMILAGTSVAWWVGVENMLYAFGFSAIIQLLAYPVANKFNLGVMKPRKSMGFELKQKEREEKERLAREQAVKDGVEYIDISEETVTEKPRSTNPFAVFFHWLNGKVDNLFNGKSATERRFLPYGPALYLTFTLLAIVYACYFAVYVEPVFL